jgi:hypothetical protein
MFKKFVSKFVEKIYKMGCLEGSGLPVLYIGRTVHKRLRSSRQNIVDGRVVYSDVCGLVTWYAPKKLMQ